MKIDFTKLNEKQILNLNQAIKSYNEKSLISSASPPVLYIELTRNCMGKCVFCKGIPYNDPMYNMKDSVFDILLEAYIPYAVLVDLRGWGESLMLPNFDKYVNKVARLGPKIRITTTLGCGTKKALQSLIDNDVYVCVSFDSADKKLYQSLRRGLSFDKVKKNIGFLTQAMRDKGTIQDNIRLAIAPLQLANLDQVEKIIYFAKKYGITQILLSQLAAGNENPNLLKYNVVKTVSILKKSLELARKMGISLQLARSPFKELYIKNKVFDRCCHPWMYMLVDFQGNALFCDHMLGGRNLENIGHIRLKKEEIWNGKKIQVQRLAHVRKYNKKMVAKCRICYKEGRYSDHEHVLASEFEKWLVTENDIERMVKAAFRN